MPHGRYATAETGAEGRSAVTCAGFVLVLRQICLHFGRVCQI